MTTHATIPTITELMSSATAANEREASERAAAAQAKRDEAVAKDREAHESFERCDTDGYLSQWASGLGAQKARLEADLIEAGGVTEYVVPFLLDGRIASTHWHTNDFGGCWVLNDDAAAVVGKRFIDDSSASKGKTRYRNNERKGLRMGTIRVRATVEYVGANVTAVRPVIKPVVAALKAGDFEVVSTDNGVGDDWA